MRYESTRTIEAKTLAGVSFTIRRMSFGRRLELTRRVRELSQRLEFSGAGDDVKDRLDAAVLSAEIDRIYVEWGACQIAGLELDGEQATPAAALELAPEEFAREIVDAIKAECSLSDEERKN
jgi:hypothetical protein